jgi:signal transduction histidine kinase
MRVRTWPLVAFALSGLLLLLGLSLMASRRRAQQIYDQLEATDSSHRQVDGLLRRLRSDIHLSGIFVRDYLLDTSQSAGPAYRQQITDLHTQTSATLGSLRELAGERESDRFERLAANIDDYWHVFDPLFDWTAVEKSARSLRFLRHEVLPRRDAVLQIAREIEEFNDANVSDQRAQMALRELELHRQLGLIMWGSLGVGALVALASVVRIRTLELRAQSQHERSEQAEREMRRLSHDLVLAQEDERRRLARELHDEVGQMLTALRMELGKAERARGQAGEAFAESSAEVKRIIDTITETVRALSMGLRPAMLDDFGLGAALDWHARDFSRRYEVPVFLSVDGDVDGLPEPHRTCVYRAVQEALTNCARHARATRIDVTVREERRRLQLSVRDDGVGLDGSDVRSHGVGLLGIQERVREIGGVVSLESFKGAGTTLNIDIPVPPSIGAGS